MGISRQVKEKVNVEEKLTWGENCIFTHGGGVSQCERDKNMLKWLSVEYIYSPETGIWSQDPFTWKNDIKSWKRSLRQIQGLPDKTSNSIILALLCVLPLESIIHKNSLNLFVNICRNEHFIEHDIAGRQLVMKSYDEIGWFNQVKGILETYNLPSIFSLFNDQTPKRQWRKILNKDVNDHTAY